MFRHIFLMTRTCFKGYRWSWTVQLKSFFPVSTEQLFSAAWLHVFLLYIFKAHTPNHLKGLGVGGGVGHWRCGNIGYWWWWCAACGTAEAWRSPHHPRGPDRGEPETDAAWQGPGRHGDQEEPDGGHLRAPHQQGQAVAKVALVLFPPSSATSLHSFPFCMVTSDCSGFCCVHFMRLCMVSSSIFEIGFIFLTEVALVSGINPLGPRPAAAFSLQNPIQREVTVPNDPGIQLQKSIINTKQKFQLTSYFPQFANTVFLYIQQILIFSPKNKSIN